MERDASTREFMDRLEDYLRFVVPYYVAEGKSYLTVAIGCTGGRHRSVMIAERLRRALGRRSACARAGPPSGHGACMTALRPIVGRLRACRGYDRRS